MIPKITGVFDSIKYTLLNVFENVVLNRHQKHVQLRQLLTSKQHGFFRGRSTISSITDLVEFLINNIESENRNYTWLHKSFWLPGPHSMKTIGINWFKSFLTGRTQIVEVKHTEKEVTNIIQSRLLPVTTGVHEGSLLGPTFFILYTNDRQNTLSTTTQN